MSDINKPKLFKYKDNIKQYFVDLDLWYRQNRPNKNWIIKDVKYISHRSVFGYFKVPITRYLVNKKTKYNDDQYNEIKFDFDLNTIIKKQFISRVSYNQISQNINYAYRKSSIDNIVKLDINNTNFNVENRDYINQITGNIIYVEIDDCYLNLRNEDNRISKYRNRLMVLHQGVFNGVCLNKTVVLETVKVGYKGKEIDYLSTKIKHIIRTKYGIKNPKIIVISDGARWMKKLSKMLNSSHILDRFHINFNIKKCGILLRKNTKFNTYFYLKYGSRFDSFLIKLIKNNDVETVINILISLLENNENYALKQAEINAIKCLIRYLINNKKLINHNEDKYYIGSRTEAFISHFVKKNTYKKFAILSLKTFKFLLKQQENSNTIMQFL